MEAGTPVQRGVFFLSSPSPDRMVLETLCGVPAPQTHKLREVRLCPPCSLLYPRAQDNQKVQEQTKPHKSAGANEVPFHRWKTEALKSCRSQSTQVGDGSQEVRSGAVIFISVCSLAGPGGPQTGSLRSQMPHARGKPQAFLSINAGHFKSVQLCS